MATLDAGDTQLQLHKPGLYKVTVAVNRTSYSGTSGEINIAVNGTSVGRISIGGYNLAIEDGLYVPLLINDSLSLSSNAVSNISDVYLTLELVV